MTLRTRVHEALESPDRTALNTVIRLLLATMILLNVVAVVLDTVPSIHDRAGTWIDRFEDASLLVFGVEYLLRLWSAPEQPRFAEGVSGRLRWMLTPVALVDLVALAPAFLPGGADLRLVRIVRLLRVIRIFKLGRYSTALRTLRNVLRDKTPDLLSLAFLLLILLVLSSAAMYHLESDAQPDTFSSIPAAMWWGIVTLTTIGYGDMAPVTELGRVLGGFIAVLGIGMFALPAGLLGAAFVDELGKTRAAGSVATAPRAQGPCPHCGK